MATKKFLAKKMSRVIYINESTINLIKEAEQEIYFYSFQNAVKDFLMELLTHQTNPTLPEFFNDVISMVVDIGQASTSLIQRRFKVGYARAGRIIDQMEARGIISGYEGSKPRKVLMSKERWDELNMMQEPQNNDE